MCGEVITITSKDEWDNRLAQAKDEGKACIVGIFAEWCVPWRTIEPVFKKMCASSPTIYFLKVDADAVPDVAELCGNKAVPAFQAWKDGTKKSEFEGALPTKLQTMVTNFA